MAKEIKTSFEEKIKELEKKFGKGSIIGGSSAKDKLEVVNSGSLALNQASVIGGIPVGKIIEVMGPESSGKSTLMLHIIANFQKAGKRAVLCDSEHSFDKKYATDLGVDTDALYITQPDCQEEGYNMVHDLVKTGEVGLIVIDSHTAMLPKKQIEGEIGESVIGLSARNNSQFLAKMKKLLDDNNCTLLAVSQTRVNIGGYGDPNISTGGSAFKFYSDMRFKVSKQTEKEDERNKTTVEIIKSKVGKPFGKAVFKIVWGKGIDPIQEVLDFALEFGYINKGGAWYEVDGNKFQGEEKVLNFLSDNPEYFQSLKEKVIEKLKTN